MLVLCAGTAAQDRFSDPAVEATEEFNQAFKRGSELSRRDPDGAVVEFKRAAKLRDDKCPECFQAIARIHFRYGEYREAADYFRRAADLKPSNEADLLNGAGVSLFLLKQKNDYEEAVVVLQKSIELSKGKLPKAYYNLGCALVKAGREEEGIAALKTYAELEPSTPEAENALRMIANPKLVGEPFARAFKVKSTSGEELSLDRFRGKVVLLDFWAAWCVPCRVEMPEVKKMVKKYSGEKFVIVGVNLDSTRKEFEDYVKQEGLTWLQYYDGLGWGNKLAVLYGVTSIPHTILIDQDGIVRGTGLRGGELSQKVGELLKRPSAGSAAGTN